MGSKNKGKKDDYDDNNNNNKKMITDSRFASVYSDPRFQNVPKQKSKVAIDSRFDRMFTDKNFASSTAPFDKRGKPKKNLKTSKSSLQHYYRTEVEDKEIEKEEKRKETDSESESESESELREAADFESGSETDEEGDDDVEESTTDEDEEDVDFDDGPEEEFTWSVLMEGENNSIPFPLHEMGDNKSKSSEESIHPPPQNSSNRGHQARQESVPLVQNRTFAKVMDGEGNISLRLTSVLLNTNNYPIWVKGATNALVGKGRFGFVNGKIKKPFNDDEFDEWNQIDKMVITWILNSIEPKLWGIFSNAETSKGLWESIRNMYGQGRNLLRIYELKSFLNRLNQNGLSTVELLGKFVEAWDELKTYRPETRDLSILLARKNEDKVFAYLDALDEKFSDVRSHILRNVSMPSFEDVCYMVNKEETAHRLSATKNTQGVMTNALIAQENPKAEASLVKGKGNFGEKGRYLRQCEHCGKVGHNMDRCWILHPSLMPPRFKKGKGLIGNGGNGGTHSAKVQFGEHHSAKGLTSSTESKDTFNIEEIVKLVKNQLRAEGRTSQHAHHFDHKAWDEGYFDREEDW